MSGGGRCNLTNAVVTERDYSGGKPTIVRRVLRGFPVADTVAFFRELGVALHEEDHGKLFPDTNRARTVLDALTSEARRLEVRVVTSARVTSASREDDAFRLATTAGDMRATRLVLAAGGRSLPKSGSDGSGYELARQLGHTIVPTTPALVPLRLEDGARSLHRELSGVAHEAELTLWVDDAVALRLTGALLWTHFGISGPVVLDMSRHWLRAREEGRPARLTLGFHPGATFDDIERDWTGYGQTRASATVASQLTAAVPGSVARALLARLGIDGGAMLAHLSRDARRRLAHALTAWPLDVTGDRGYTYAEATAGGVSLDEIDPGTMASRRCPGLSLVGEVLDVDGRLGGFNFQWAWSSARVAASGLGA